MKIIIDRNIRGADDTFAHHGELHAMDGRAITPHDVADADLLIIRTATRADRKLLEGSRVRFVGTTSIGTDHLDIPWLEKAGIAWANAPGCNADSAAQYTLAMIWLACQRLGRPLAGSRAGIVGRGNVGSRTLRLLRTLGVDVVANDPPLADAGTQGLVSLDEALARDIVCLHVPLTRQGPYPTLRMIDATALARTPRGALLVNTARGDVVDGAALLDAIRHERIHAALDVWPGEPRLDPELLRRSVVATPHVAGYSDDGKRNGTRQVYEAFCDWAGVAPKPLRNGIEPLSLTLDPERDALTQALEAACFVPQHDAALRDLASGPADDIARGFDGLRKAYPFRRDFHGWRIRGADRNSAVRLSALGFGIDHA
jgi:erythronate-4-phosphate dehydrogenase